MRTFFCFVIAALMCLGGKASAQDIQKYAKVSAPGNWVKVNIPSSDVPEKAVDMDSFYPLVDWQYRITEKDREFYGRFVEKLNTAKGVEDNSTVTISFDPEYQTITLHHLHIIRDGKIIDRLELSEFYIYRAETDRDKLIYNGDLELAYILPDVRPGDTLDYAFTRHGKNLATGPNFFLRFQQKYDDVTTNFRQRALVHNDVAVYSKSINGGIDPQITQSGNYRSFDWNLEGHVPMSADANRPDWHFGWPTYHVGSYENWGDVGKYFSRHYEIPDPLPNNVRALAEDIRAAYDTPEQQLREALNRIQKDIRYLGVELGTGGYIPRGPERVLDRRYGDCKDMTLLLVSVLKGLGIHADPFLVETDIKGEISQWLPTHRAFDHIVVRAKIGDKTYILDPTKGEQLGDLDNLQQGQFEKGLIVSIDSPGLVDADVPEPEYFEDFREEFDLVSDPNLILLTSTSTYFMHRADSMSGWYKSNGLEDVEKSFLEYFQDYYPTIEQVGDMRIETDKIRGAITFAVDYKITDPWDVDKKNATKTFSAFAREIDNELPEFDGAKRKHPYKMAHPVKTRETIVFSLDESWSLENEDVSVENDAFSYRKNAIFKDNVYTEVYSVVSKTDHITAAAYTETMAEIDKIDENLGVELFVNIDVANDKNNDWGDILTGAFSILWLSGLLIGLGFFFGRKF